MEGLIIKHKSSVGTGLLTACLILPVVVFLNHMIAQHHGQVSLLHMLQPFLITPSLDQDENSLQPIVSPQEQEAVHPAAVDIAAQPQTPLKTETDTLENADSQEVESIDFPAQRSDFSDPEQDDLPDPVIATTRAVGVNPDGDETLPTLLFNQPLTEELINHWLVTKQAYMVCQSVSQIWYVWQTSPGQGHFTPFYEYSAVGKNLSQREVQTIPTKLRARLHRQFHQDYSGECPVSLRFSVGLDNQIAQQQRALQAQSGKTLPQTVFEIKLTETGQSVFNYIVFSAE